MVQDKGINGRRSTDVIVVGAGVSGLTAACTLARLGLGVLVVERENRPGGRVAELACMATDRCRRCSACLLHDLRSEADRYASIVVRTGCTVTGAARTASGSTLDVAPAAAVASAGAGAGQAETWTARAAMICTGFDVFDAARKPFLGYGRLPGVVTTLELDHVLARDGAAGWLVQGAVPRRVAFVQCVGSRESKEGRGYCSQVCCQVSLRLAGKLLQASPETEITIHYIDLQLARRNVAATHEELRTRIRFVQGVPGEITASPGGGLLARHEDRGDGKGTSTVFDAVVLAVGMAPRPDTARICAWLGIEPGGYGFASHGACPVVAAGACTFPMDIQGSMNEARDAARAVARALGTGGYAAAAGAAGEARHG